MNGEEKTKVKLQMFRANMFKINWLSWFDRVWCMASNHEGEKKVWETYYIDEFSKLLENFRSLNDIELSKIRPLIKPRDFLLKTLKFAVKFVFPEPSAHPFTHLLYIRGKITSHSLRYLIFLNFLQRLYIQLDIFDLISN